MKEKLILLFLIYNSMNLALFDFDGTITREDSFVRYLKMISKSKIDFWFKYYLKPIHLWILLKIKVVDYWILKKKRLQIFFNDLTNEEILDSSASFQSEVLPLIIRNSAKERIKWHQEQGDEILIVSATFDFCLNNWCKQAGVNYICNYIKRQENNIIFLPNNLDCNFYEKVNRVKSSINLEQYSLIYAYGDSSGDRDMLAIANQPFFKFFND